MRCLGRTEADRQITKRAVVDAEDQGTIETTRRGGLEKFVQKKILTGPTLLEMPPEQNQQQ